MAAHKGFFKPNFPNKYMGNPKGIVYRSNWEFKVFMQLDHDPNVIRWASEEIIIPYYSTVNKKVRRYFPDVYYETRDNKKYLVEVKPFAQCIPPKKSKNQRKFLNEAKTYTINQDKWKAARNWCKERGIKFKILTEKELFPKKTIKRK